MAQEELLEFTGPVDGEERKGGEDEVGEGLGKRQAQGLQKGVKESGPRKPRSY